MKAELQNEKNCIIGVISDTHGTLPPPVNDIFSDVDLIIHAGDIGGMNILDELESIAPVVAVRGNMDMDEWSFGFNAMEKVKACGVLLYVLHDLHKFRRMNPTTGFNAVISGHTHCPSAERHNEVLYLNPGSATQPRHSTAPSVALLYIRNTILSVRFVEL